VDYIYGKKLDQSEGNVKYKVKWTGWDFTDSTWEPPLNLEDIQWLVKNFESFYSRHIFFHKIGKTEPAKKPESKKRVNEYDFDKIDEFFEGKKKIKTEIEPIEGLKKKEIDEESYKKYGNFEKDLPLKIIKHKLKNVSNNIRDTFYKIEWSARKNGVIPLPSYFPYDVVKAKCADLLMSYLEEHGNVK